MAKETTNKPITQKPVEVQKPLESPTKYTERTSKESLTTKTQ